MVSYNDIISNNNLSPHQLSIMEFSNKNVIKLGDLLYRNLSKDDNGRDIGSSNYIKKSDYKFLKTKIANKNSFIIDASNSESFDFMNYKAFVNQKLQQGDILISKDSNIGEACILDKDYSNCMVASAFYKLPLRENKYYIFSFLKTNHFKKQLDLMVPKGATIRHAGTKFLECKIPFPNGKDASKIIEYIEFLTKLVINKEAEIVKKENAIFEVIEKELNQNSHCSKYSFPKLNDMLSGNRIDSGFYGENLNKINSLIKNYKHGYKSIKNCGYSISRGQNLQISCIGKSIISQSYKEGFYKVAKPTDLSDYGTVNQYTYIGNKKELSLLKDGDIVFSAEGTIGKCTMFVDVNDDKIITNIHGIILNKKNHNVEESGFICSFLRYLRKKNFFEYLSVGGQGGSLAMKYWDNVIVPNFPESIIKQISNLYCGKCLEEENLDKQEKYNFEIIQKQSIMELNDSINKIKGLINQLFNKIVKDENINII